MNDCSNCDKAVEVSPTSHVCNMGPKKYVISNFPSQGNGCQAFVETDYKIVRVHSKDPLVNFFLKKRNKHSIVQDDAERRILEAYEKNMGSDAKEKFVPTQTVFVEPSKEINFKYAMGWIISAVLCGTFISLWLLGLIG